MSRILLSLLLPLLALLQFSCERAYTPRPRGYMRIDLPEKHYRLFDSIHPYCFEYPVYARVVTDDRPQSEPYWINLDFPGFKGRLHMSYKVVDNNLDQYLEDSRTLVIKHIPKADAIDDSLIYRPGNRVFGIIYYISGSEAASPCQFVVTDSTRHFLRGALYFNFVPNNDSLRPVIDFIEEDIRHLVATLRWKNEQADSSK